MGTKGEGEEDIGNDSNSSRDTLVMVIGTI